MTKSNLTIPEYRIIKTADRHFYVQKKIWKYWLSVRSAAPDGTFLVINQDEINSFGKPSFIGPLFLIRLRFTSADLAESYIQHVRNLDKFPKLEKPKKYQVVKVFSKTATPD